MYSVTHCIIRTSFVLSALIASAEVFGAAAGILIYANIEDTPYVLMADHKHVHQMNRGWGVLGGTVDGNEGPLDAAIREVIEESNGAFAEADLRRVVDSRTKILETGYTTYFARTRFQPATFFSNSVADVAQGVKGERGPFAWIPWPVVTKAATEAATQEKKCEFKPVKVPPEYLPEHRQTSWFYCAFLRTVELIEKTGGLPKSNKKLQPIR
ncbi:MAG: NUDIX domain-containing protein [Gammaproteobacteria bacterium]